MDGILAFSGSLGPKEVAMKKGYCTVAVFCSALILSSNMAHGKQVAGWKESGKNRIKEVGGFVGQKRPDVNCRDKDGRTPLHWAVLSGHESLVELLLSRGADINCQDKEGKTPLIGRKRKDCVLFQSCC